MSSGIRTDDKIHLSAKFVVVVVSPPFSFINGVVVTSKCFVGDRFCPPYPTILDVINLGDIGVGVNETDGYSFSGKRV